MAVKWPLVGSGSGKSLLMSFVAYHLVIPHVVNILINVTDCMGGLLVLFFDMRNRAEQQVTGCFACSLT